MIDEQDDEVVAPQSDVPAASAHDRDADAPAPYSPSVRASWLLRTAAVVGPIAAAAGLVVARGVEGLAGEGVVDITQRIASVLGSFFLLLCLLLVFWGGYEILRVRRAPAAARAIVLVGSAATIAVTLVGFVRGVATPLLVVLAAAASASAVAAAWSAMREPRTRAVGVVLGALGLAALARLVAWEIASSAPDIAALSTRARALGGAFATAGVVFEALAQLTAVAWMGTRAKLTGQILSSLAITGAFVVTYGVAKGGSSGVFWQQLVHRALYADASSLPPFGLDRVSPFLAAASMFLAFVAAIQPRQVVSILAALSLALLSRGAFDVPLHALALAAAAHWITIASGDDRAMWSTLVAGNSRA